MKHLPIILTLFLTVIWAYTCWYWYTCSIKGFCDEKVSYTVSQAGDSPNYYNQENTAEKMSIKNQENIISGGTESSPKLTAQDVLFDPLPKEIEQEKITLSGSVTEKSIETIEEIPEKDEEIKEEKISTETKTICESPLVGPIVLGGDNNKQEVEKLETFLITRGESISIDGEYGNDDLEAIKRFQLEYKSEVLDPWGITTPTGYVGRTSIAKINDLACK